VSAFGQRDDVSDETPILFSRRHRTVLLATPCLLFVVVAGGKFGLIGVFYYGLYLSLVVGGISSVGVVHAFLILMDAPERRVPRNVVPALLCVGSLLLFVYLLLNAGYQ
jgi:asparagine N-glycosylation enzyme membrane subunit Stt3